MLEIGNDTIICEGESLILKSNSNLTSWSDGTTGKELKVDKSGIFWGEIVNSCSSYRDSIIISTKNCLPCTIDCKNIGSANWNMSTNSTYIGNTWNGSATLIGDIHIGLIHPF